MSAQSRTSMRHPIFSETGLTTPTSRQEPRPRPRERAAYGLHSFREGAPMCHVHIHFDRNPQSLRGYRNRATGRERDMNCGGPAGVSDSSSCGSLISWSITTLKMAPPFHGTKTTPTHICKPGRRRRAWEIPVAGGRVSYPG